jgi:hypothetical protein
MSEQTTTIQRRAWTIDLYFPEGVERIDHVTHVDFSARLNVAFVYVRGRLIPMVYPMPEKVVQL